VPYKLFNLLLHRCKFFSIARRCAVDGLAEVSAVGDLPLWHSAVFKNSQHLTYYYYYYR